MKHTPGPWEVGLDTLGSPVVVARKYAVATLSWCGFNMGGWHKGGPNAEAKRIEISANARLVAAAPELLEALKALLDDAPFSMNPESAAIHQQAVDVIAKAEGVDPETAPASTVETRAEAKTSCI